MITTDEVIRMTSAQLRIEAAKLDGWTECQIDRGQPFGVVPELYTGYPYSEILPDYLNDWDAAMSLVEKLQEAGFIVILTFPHDGNLNAIRVIHGMALGCPPVEIVNNPHLFKPSDIVAEGQEDSIKRAITRAFILAMDGVA